ncbi:MAG: YihY/virulence factor BrkB family protein [Bacteroidetes bacterium]|nr:YihY/virulence factor BrkB family protein [Bacteroidota bacterium]
MANAVTLFKRISHFLTHSLWRVRLDKLEKKQSFFIRQLRIFSLAINGFNEDKCLLKATALTYYTLFSIVPIIALAFAIAKGFGFETISTTRFIIKISRSKRYFNTGFCVR